MDTPAYIPSLGRFGCGRGQPGNNPMAAEPTCGQLWEQTTTITQACTATALNNGECTFTCKPKAAKFSDTDNGEDNDADDELFGEGLTTAQKKDYLKPITAIAADLKCKWNNVVSHHKWRWLYRGYTDTFGGKRILDVADAGGFELAAGALTDLSLDEAKYFCGDEVGGKVVILIRASASPAATVACPTPSPNPIRWEIVTGHDTDPNSATPTLVMFADGISQRSFPRSITGTGGTVSDNPTLECFGPGKHVGVACGPSIPCPTDGWTCDLCPTGASCAAASVCTKPYTCVRHANQIHHSVVLSRSTWAFASNYTGLVNDVDTMNFAADPHLDTLCGLDNCCGPDGVCGTSDDLVPLNRMTQNSFGAGYASPALQNYDRELGVVRLAASPAGATMSGSIATFTTSGGVPHNLVAGKLVSIRNVANASYSSAANRAWKVETVLSASSFTATCAGTACPSALAASGGGTLAVGCNDDSDCAWLTGPATCFWKTVGKGSVVGDGVGGKAANQIYTAPCYDKDGDGNCDPLSGTQIAPTNTCFAHNTVSDALPILLVDGAVSEYDASSGKWLATFHTADIHGWGRGCTGQKNGSFDACMHPTLTVSGVSPSGYDGVYQLLDNGNPPALDKVRVVLPVGHENLPSGGGGTVSSGNVFFGGPGGVSTYMTALYIDDVSGQNHYQSGHSMLTVQPWNYIFAASRTLGAVSSATNTLSMTAHGMSTGDGPYNFENTGGALPQPLTAGTDYWVIVVDANTFKLASSRANALAGVAIVLTTDGTGTDTFKKVMGKAILMQGCAAPSTE